MSTECPLVAIINQTVTDDVQAHGSTSTLSPGRISRAFCTGEEKSNTFPQPPGPCFGRRNVSLRQRSLCASSARSFRSPPAQASEAGPLVQKISAARVGKSTKSASVIHCRSYLFKNVLKYRTFSWIAGRKLQLSKMIGKLKI